MNKKLKLEELDRLSIEDFKKSIKDPIIVLLDNVRSLHNIGSVFRTCDAMGVSKIYLCGITAQPPHREIRKTAIGATESVDWEYAETPLEVINKYKKLKFSSSFSTIFFHCFNFFPMVTSFCFIFSFFSYF